MPTARFLVAPLVALVAAAAPAPALGAKPPLVKDAHVTVGAPTGGAVPRVSPQAQRVYGVVVFGRKPEVGLRIAIAFRHGGRVVARWTTRARAGDELLYARLLPRFYRGHAGRWRLDVRAGQARRVVRFRIGRA